PDRLSVCAAQRDHLSFLQTALNANLRQIDVAHGKASAVQFAVPYDVHVRLSVFGMQGLARNVERIRLIRDQRGDTYICVSQEIALRIADCDEEFAVI